jgi:hypothetical protein
MNLISFNPNFARILLLSTAFVVSINTIAGVSIKFLLHNTTMNTPGASVVELTEFFCDGKICGRGGGTYGVVFYVFFSKKIF